MGSADGSSAPRLQLSTYQYMHGRKLPEAGKEPLHRSRTIFGNHIGLGIVGVTTSLSEKDL